MQEFLILGKGMTTHPSVPSSLLADVFESLVAAIYLDGGDAAARRFITDTIGPEIELAAEGETGSNYKSLLQQLAQREHGTTPDLPVARREGARPQQVLQSGGPGGRQPLSAGLGTEQEEKPSSVPPATR